MVSLRCRSLATWFKVALLVAACGGKAPPPRATEAPPRETKGLRGPEAFASITDDDERARAIFLEASKVLLHPRCVNCHPPDDVPRQREEMTFHSPPVTRGPEDRGVVGMTCSSCHQDRNVEGTRVPGAPNWHLAPLEMAWLGRTPGQICAQIKDPDRNGGKTIAQIVEHSAHDELVGWGWAPGADREPAPGTQQLFGALMEAWAAAGAACPTEEAR